MKDGFHLWVNNQPCDSDCTSAYLEAAHYTPPRGVTLDVEAQTISGEISEDVWNAFRDLQAAVAAVGHGVEAPDTPTLTMCPFGLIEQGYTSAGESLARDLSVTAKSWKEYRNSVVSFAQSR